ncbi:MAG: PAS domain S-box protein [Phycisphaerales bacterium]|nr:PAS domain S-box protein [Phycisphaerales bacterium]
MAVAGRGYVPWYHHCAVSRYPAIPRTQKVRALRGVSLRAVVVVLGAFAIVGGAMSFAGWAFDFPRLTDWEGNGISIQPNTTLAVMAAGAALLFLVKQHRATTFWLGVFVALVGSTAAFQYASGINLGIDTPLLFGRTWGGRGTLAPGRMGPPASVSWSLLGLALAATATDKPLWRRIASGLGIVVICIASLSLMGYVFGADRLYSLPRLTTIALQTTTMILAVAAGLLCSLPDRQPLRTLLSRSAAGLLVRRALPAVVTVPVVLGFLQVVGQARGLFDAPMGAAALVLLVTVLLVAILWSAARAVESYEERLRASEVDLQTKSDQLATFLETAAIALHRVGPDGTILWANEAELKTLGYAPHEYIGRRITEFHADGHVIDDILARLHRGETLREYEAQMICKDGSLKDVLIDSSVLRVGGTFLHTQCFTRDITERKRLEVTTQRHGKELEQALRERTLALEASHQQLRIAERMAALGNLSAGLGHDMGNLLLPVRMRLESLEKDFLSPRARDDVRAIRTSAEYLQRLANGLRLLALDPSRASATETTDLRDWWNDAQRVMAGVLSRGIVLEASLPDGECPVGISAAALTQVVFNLVQNAGDSMRTRGTGTIRVRGRCEGEKVRLCVSDDGPGMTPEVQARCMEPFFTTKTRAISTGLGLALVHGLIKEAGGTVEVESVLGRGTTFSLLIPLARAAQPAANEMPQHKRAVLHLRDSRLRSFVALELRALQFDIVEEHGDPGAADLFVLDDAGRVAGVQGAAPVVYFGDSPESSGTNTRSLGKAPTISIIRQALVEAASLRRGQPNPA